MIVRVVPTASQIEEAREGCTSQAFNDNTIDPKGQPVGNIAEIVFREWLKSYFIEHDYLAKDKKYYDFVIGGTCLDVKAKRRTGSNSDHSEIHVSLYLEDQFCHYYVVASVVVPDGHLVPSVVELIGFISKPNFWEHPAMQRVKKGQNTGTSSRPFIERADAGKLNHKHLRSMDEFRDKIETYLYKRAFGEVG